MATAEPVGVPGAEVSDISDYNSSKVVETDEKCSVIGEKHAGVSGGSVICGEEDEEQSTEGAKDRLVFADQLASDYSKYLQPNVDSEKRELDESIEQMLTQIAEFCEVVDAMRSDTNLCLKSTVPKIKEKSDQLEGVFDKIDQLQVFVDLVKGQADALEAGMTEAERQMGTFSNIKSRVRGLFQNPFVKKHQNTSSQFKGRPFTVSSQYTPVKIYKTEDFFPTTGGESPPGGAAGGDSPPGGAAGGDSPREGVHSSQLPVSVTSPPEVTPDRPAEEIKPI